MGDLEDMIKRIGLMNKPQYKNDLDELASQIIDFLNKYDLKGIMGFYKKEQFKISILFDEDSVNTNIFNS